MSRTPADLTVLESALAGLAPRVGTLNRDRLMYEAGKQAVPRRLSWPIAASLFAVVSVALGLILVMKPEPTPRTVERVVYVPAPMPQREHELPVPALVKSGEAKWGNAFHSSAGYLSQRDQVLFFGIDALPATPSGPESPREQPQDLKALHGSI